VDKGINSVNVQGAMSFLSAAALPCPPAVRDVRIILTRRFLGGNERSPEQSAGALFVFAGEEFRPGCDELVQTERSVVVGVDRLEGGRGGLGVKAEEVKEQFELVLLDGAIIVGVDCAEEDRQRS